MNRTHQQTGFTLVEIAIVLVIVALLIGGVLAPLSTQKEQERRAENQDLLEEAREALIGFAAVNGYLPCPDTNGDGVENTGPNLGDCGRTTATSANFYPNGVLGRLPWVTLGINAEFDPWGDNHFIGYAVNGAYVRDDLALTSTSAGPGQLDIYTAANCVVGTQAVATDIPAVIWTSAKNFYFQPPISSVDENENVDNDNCFVNRNYNTVTNFEFDDQMIWLSRNILFNRMITAGQLP